MPLAYAGLVSGMLTLAGTAPNLVVDSVLRHAGHAGFGFFSFTPFGSVILIAGVCYLLVARHWLNRNDQVGSTDKGRRRQMMDFVKDYRLEDREYRLGIDADSPLVSSP